MPELAEAVPLCERHIFQSYRATNAMLATKTASDQQYELLPSEAEYVPGPCPSCGTTGLLVNLANGIIECRAADCGYGATAADFGRRRKRMMGAAAGTQDVVYYMRLGNRVKIGTSRNLANRMETFNPEDCMAYELGTRKVERRRHEQFRHLRVVGEWFALASDLVQHINGLGLPVDESAKRLYADARELGALLDRPSR